MNAVIKRSTERGNPMCQYKNYFIVASCSLFLFFGSSGVVSAAETKCSMVYSLKSWSILYKSGKGSGTITCDNGQSARVHLRSQGGGITVGTSQIVGGHGVFSNAHDIKELFGSYANASAHGGAGDAGASQALTKGDISLALTGSGKGVNVGVDFGSFKITQK